jgi:hypothetical protein
MITTDGERVKPSLAATRHGERARVTYLSGRPGTSPIRKQLEGVICESLNEGRLMLFAGDRHSSIHLTRIQQVVVLS